MKTFTDYINEKQNFIFGGKAGLTGKEYKNEYVIFAELKEGDLYYVWRIDKGKAQYITKDIRIVLNVTEIKQTKKLKIHYEHKIDKYPQLYGSVFIDIERTYDNVLVNETDKFFFLYATCDMTDVEARKKVAEVVASGNYQKWER